jgi:poly(3-hydroxybutyrate) depolymerase
MYRYEIPIGGWHIVTLHGPIRHVASREHGVVEVWAENSDTNLPHETLQPLMVVGTGHAWPEGDSMSRVEWVGTALAPHGLVWHVLRLVDMQGFPYPEVTTET